MMYVFNLAGDSGSRGFAYFMGYIIAANVSGAYFNPAVSVAGFIAEWNPKQGLSLLLVVIAQYTGAFAGFLVSFLLAKDYG